MKKFAQQQERIDSVYSEIGPQETQGRLRNFDLAAKRAVSLPDMLNDQETSDNEKYTISDARKIWILKQSQSKSIENLL